jgi:hypothetical protein
VVPEACRGARSSNVRWRWLCGTVWSARLFEYETDGSAAKVASSSACNLEGLGVRMGRVESEEGCRLVGRQSAICSGCSAVSP